MSVGGGVGGGNIVRDVGNVDRHRRREGNAGERSVEDPDDDEGSSVDDQIMHARLEARSVNALEPAA